MTDEARLKHLLRSSLPPTEALEPSRDLWPLIASHRRTKTEWPWIDFNLGIITIILLLLFPSLFLLLAYHL